MSATDMLLLRSKEDDHTLWPTDMLLLLSKEDDDTLWPKTSRHEHGPQIA